MLLLKAPLYMVDLDGPRKHIIVGELVATTGNKDTGGTWIRFHPWAYKYYLTQPIH